MSTSQLLLALGAVPAVYGLVRPDGVGRLPALGWNSWNAYHCDVDADKIMTAAKDMVSLGFKDAGYVYVNQDDCWQDPNGRSNTTFRMVPNPTTYPDGIDGLASQIHALGLKFGIYSSAGTLTCGGYTASLGYEEVDAATWAEWGVDYLKYDNCYVPEYWGDTCYSCIPDSTYGQGFVNGTCTNTSGEFRLCDNGWPTDGRNYTASYTALRYRIMQNALEAQNRTILYSLCEWGTNEPWTWGNITANSWRTTDDIEPSWSRIVEILNMNSFLGQWADFTGHNDPDMLEVGNGNLTTAECRTHFALWALMKSPLIIGTDLGNLSKTNIQILQNKYLLAFNQDPVHGKPAFPYSWGINPDYTFNNTNPAEFWSGAMTNGTMVAMMNTLNTSRNMTTTFSKVPELKSAGPFQVTDAWTGKSLGCLSNVTSQLQPHDTAVYLVQGKCKKSSESASKLKRWWKA